MSGFTDEALTSMLEWRLKTNPTYAALLSSSGDEPRSGGYMRKLVSFDFNIPGIAELSGANPTWTNSGDTPWDVAEIGFFSSSSGGEMVAKFDAGRGMEPAVIKSPDVLRLPKVKFSIKNTS